MFFSFFWHRYILSIQDAEDLQDYMLDLLDGSDPTVRAFLPCLMEKWYATGDKPRPIAKVSSLAGVGLV